MKMLMCQIVRGIRVTFAAGRHFVLGAVVVGVVAGVGAGSGCEPGLTAPVSDVVSLAGGQFVMGSSQDCQDTTGVFCKGDRGPHFVKLSPFSMQVTEVSQIQYASCALQSACPAQGSFDPKQKNRPMLVDDPEAARSYCRSLGLRLPTEAEFEYAARVDKLGQEHVYPWGHDDSDDKSPSCAQLTLAGCGGKVGDVGSAPKDVTDQGIHDLAGSVPEWVEDTYQVWVSCADRVGYDDICFGQGASCAQTRCASDGAACARGCLPQSEDLSSTGHGGGVTSVPVCQLSPDAAQPAIDPVARAATGLAVVRGGGGSDGACSFAGFTRRHAVPHRYQAGFRCVQSSGGTLALRPLTSYRFVITGCQADAPTVKVSIASSNNPNSVFQLDVYASSGDPIATQEAKSGVVDNMPCGGLFIVHPSEAKPLTVQVRSSDAQGCRAGMRQVDLSAGGDVPAVGVDQLPLVGPCM